MVVTLLTAFYFWLSLKVVRGYATPPAILLISFITVCIILIPYIGFYVSMIALGYLAYTRAGAPTPLSAAIVVVITKLGVGFTHVGLKLLMTATDNL